MMVGENEGATIAATEIIVRKLQAQGYKFQTVSQMRSSMLNAIALK